jgi:hypothetical protein
MFKPNPKPVTWVNEAYREFVSQLPSCFRCNHARLPGEYLHAHHERIGGGGGTALKPSDVYILPLCGECHITRHSSAFDSLRVFYNLWGNEAIVYEDEVAKLVLHKAMLENLNSFLFTMKVLKYAR